MATKIRIIYFTCLLMIYFFYIHPAYAYAQSTWAHTYGGSNNDWAYSIQQTSDGGYIVAGFTASFGDSSGDMWVLKLDANGAIIWQKTYGGSNSDEAHSIQQTLDGGYIVVGTTESFGAGSPDFWVLELDSKGEIVWQKTYGGSNVDVPTSIQQTSDGGYVVTGETCSFGHGGDLGASDVWVLKLDSNGEIGSTCNFIENTSIVPVPTSITASDSYASANDISIMTSATGGNTRSTEVIPIGQCASGANLQPYMGTKPAVDDSGSSTSNGIIEPDESVSLRGILLNIGDIDAINATGILSTIDPITITQPKAIYGIVPSGGNQPCTTCYALTAPLINRPATHWHFHVNEQVSADSFGPVNYQYDYHVGHSFSDVPPSQPFYSYIEKILHAGVTNGCTRTAYCPSAMVQRQSMAKFICDAINTIDPDYCIPQRMCRGIFADVPVSNVFCVYIEWLNWAGIALGCKSSPPQYCPADNVSRDTMAKFICNATDETGGKNCYPASCTGIFADVPPSNPFCGYIEAAYNLGITSGCGSSLYCPNLSVTRDQMAKFIVNAFGLTL